ncbi:MAG TPA: aspartyl protease family protein [Thermoanaerobaculia bacterium]
MRTLPGIAVTIALSVLLRQTPAQGCSIPLERTRTSSVTTVQIGTAGPFRFLFDTGTSVTVITPEVARRLGITASETMQAMTATGAVDVQRAVLDDLLIGTVAIRRLEVLIAPLPHFQSHGRLDGILGMDFLAGRSFLLDVAHRCVDVDAPVPARGSLIQSSDVVGRVALHVGELNFVLDSAASFTVLMSQRAASLASVDDTVEVTSAAGRRRVVSGVIPRLRLGDLTLLDVPSAIVSKNTGGREDALLPVMFFSSVYVAADRRSVILAR